MTTKTEHREYIASEKWQKRRKEYLLAMPICEKCELPRRLAIVAYDQDLHVHHKSYARVGAELDDDLQSLCRRCHEVETFGSSSLHKVQSFECLECSEICFDRVDRLCDGCRVILIGEWRNPVICRARSLHNPDQFVYQDLIFALLADLATGINGKGIEAATDELLTSLAETHQKLKRILRRP